MSGRRGLLSASAALVASRALSLLAGLGAVAAVSRSLGPVEFGALSFALALAALFAPLTEMGLNAILVRAILKAPGREGEYAGTALLARLGAGAVALGLGGAAILVLKPDEPGLHLAAFVLLAGETFRAFQVCALAMEARRRFTAIAAGQAGVAILFAGGRAAAALSGAGMVGIAAIHAAEIAAGGMLFLALRRRGGAPPLAPSRRAAGELLRRSWILALSAGFATANLKIDQVMLGQMRGTAEVGVYAAAARLSELWHFVPAMVATAAFPDLAELRDRDRGAYLGAVRGLLDRIALLSWAAMAAIALGAGLAVGIAFGPDYAAAAPVLQLHVAGGIFMALRVVASKWMVIEELFALSLLSHGLGAALNVALNLALIPACGPMGAAAATVASYAGAGWIAFYAHAGTRPLAHAMGRSLLVPLRLPGIVLRRARRGAGAGTQGGTQGGAHGGAGNGAGDGAGTGAGPDR
ncbi:flippase [Rhodovulum sp. DZ06]|uniref:flippase n=1 Tax=Rhodovulum sp. DZ06 TaxID=3425126 RepID=UPI003D33FDFE